jgi:serine kinase of HPr protein (carbohydrate metabolism regulator)
MEVRGIGIINVAAMFGVNPSAGKRVDLVISLKAWNEVAEVDRWGWRATCEDPRRRGAARTIPSGPAAISRD